MSIEIPEATRSFASLVQRLQPSVMVEMVRHDTIDQIDAFMARQHPGRVSGKSRLFKPRPVVKCSRACLILGQDDGSESYLNWPKAKEVRYDGESFAVPVGDPGDGWLVYAFR